MVSADIIYPFLQAFYLAGHYPFYGNVSHIVYKNPEYQNRR